MTPPRRPEAVAALAPGSLDGRIALITGGGSGIGRATAEMLAYMGATVVVTGRREDALAETVARIGEAGGRATAYPCDIREPEAVDALLDEVLGAEKRIDLLVNNAGGQFVSKAEDITYKGFRAVERLNLDATFYVSTQVARRSMLPNGFGKIASITMTLTPHRGIVGMSHSSAARAGVESLTATWAQEWGPRGVRTIAVAPGVVHTEAWERYGLDPEQVAQVMPLKRLQTADEVAALIGFWMSPAGDYITGITLVADGGMNLAGPTLY
ncbi:MAG: SDR family NAD(P)-dependent oxidoreductase [Candidatus Nanopelagicales bacterium]